MADNAKIASDVLEAIGGSKNVSNVTHCFTRLRFNVKDRSIIDDEKVKAVNGVLGMQEKGGQYQVIIGPNVPEVYDEVCKAGGFAKQDVVDEKLDDAAEKKPLTPAGIGNAIMDYLSGTVVPLIPVLITGALFKTLATIFGPTFLNVFPADSEFAFLCNMVYNAAFYFMPVIAGASAAKKLGMNSFLGAMMGCVLIEPTFVALASTQGASFSVYGIPAPTLGYASSLIPVLLSVWAMSFISKFFDKHIHESLRTVFSPFLTMVVTLPIALCVLAPLGSYAGTGLAAFFNMLATSPLYPLAVALIGATWPLLVLTGMHLGIAAISLAQFAAVGTDNLVLLAANITNFVVTGVGLAVWMRLKNKEQKNLTLGYVITQCFGGVGEPLLYGVLLRYKRPWIGAIAGGFVAAGYAAITGVLCYAPAQGFFSFLDFVGGPQSNFINAIIAIVLGIVVGFVVTWFFGLTKEQIEGTDAE